MKGEDIAEIGMIFVLLMLVAIPSCMSGYKLGYADGKKDVSQPAKVEQGPKP